MFSSDFSDEQFKVQSHENPDIFLIEASEAHALEQSMHQALSAGNVQMTCCLYSFLHAMAAIYAKTHRISASHVTAAFAVSHYHAIISRMVDDCPNFLSCVYAGALLNQHSEDTVQDKIGAMTAVPTLIIQGIKLHHPCSILMQQHGGKHCTMAKHAQR